MNIPLKTALQQHLGTERLSDYQIHTLMTLANNHNEGRVSTDRRWFATASIMVFAVAFSIALSVIIPGGAPQYNHALIAMIADEVANNHLHRKPLESKSNRISDVDHFFYNLDVRLTEPDLIAKNGWQLLGGRYCSIRGVTAAQLRYQSIDSDIHTVYQVPYRPDHHGRLPDRSSGEVPLEVTSHDVRVLIWVDRGTLFAVASNVVKGNVETLKNN